MSALPRFEVPVRFPRREAPSRYHVVPDHDRLFLVESTTRKTTRVREITWGTEARLSSEAPLDWSAVVRVGARLILACGRALQVFDLSRFDWGERIEVDRASRAVLDPRGPSLLLGGEFGRQLEVRPTGDLARVTGTVTAEAPTLATRDTLEYGAGSRRRWAEDGTLGPAEPRPAFETLDDALSGPVVVTRRGRDYDHVQHTTGRPLYPRLDRAALVATLADGTAFACTTNRVHHVDATGKSLAHAPIKAYCALLGRIGTDALVGLRLSKMLTGQPRTLDLYCVREPDGAPAVGGATVGPLERS